MKAAAGVVAAAGLAAVACAAWWVWTPREPVQASLTTRLQDRVTTQGLASVPCGPPGAAPVVLLALGQSNAGNHGQGGGRQRAPVVLAAPQGCVAAVDPLPGATGRGSSIWSRLPARLSARGLRQPVVLAVLAVDASTIADWTDDGSPLRAELQRTLEALNAQGLTPSAILWQQGEADAARGTPADRYASGLQRLAAQLRATGWGGPLLVARSTRCRSEPALPLHAVLADWVRRDPSVRLGPDTDALAAPGDRRNGCHFATAGLDAAADLWAGRILEVLAPPATTLR